MSRSGHQRSHSTLREASFHMGEADLQAVECLKKYSVTQSHRDLETWCPGTISAFSHTSCCTSTWRPGACLEMTAFYIDQWQSTASKQESTKRLAGDCLTGACRQWSAAHLANDTSWDCRRELGVKPRAVSNLMSQELPASKRFEEMSLQSQLVGQHIIQMQHSCHQHWPPLSPTSP